MSWWFILFPLIGAMIGWSLVHLAFQLFVYPLYPKKLAGFVMQGLLFKSQPAIAKQIGVFAATFFPIRDLEEKITHPGNVKKIMPHAEEHIDQFLRVKLVQSMPVVGMFVGDKTITGLKSLFIVELEELFPVIIKNYLRDLEQDLDIEKLITDKILAIPPAIIRKEFLRATRRHRQIVGMVGAFAGFLIGVIQLLLAHWFTH